MACYVISNDAHIMNDEYKFGETLNIDTKSLLSRYNTPLNNPKILLFYETPNPKQDETIILNNFKDFRCKNSKGNYNEWLKIKFEILKEYLDEYFSKEEYKAFRDMNLKKIELRIQETRLKVEEVKLKNLNKEWKIVISKAIKDEDYFLELLNLYGKPKNTIDLNDYCEKYKILDDIHHIYNEYDYLCDKYDFLGISSTNEKEESKYILTPVQNILKEYKFDNIPNEFTKQDIIYYCNKIFIDNWIYNQNCIKLDDESIIWLCNKITIKRLNKIILQLLPLIKEKIYCYKTKTKYIMFNTKWNTYGNYNKINILIWITIIDNIINSKKFILENIIDLFDIYDIFDIFNRKTLLNDNEEILDLLVDNKKCISLLLND